MDTTTTALTKAEPADPVRVIRILSPFNPREQERTDVVWQQKPITDFFPPLKDHENEFIVCLDGKIVPPDEFPLTYPGKGSTIVLSPVIAGGGGGGKSVLRLVAMIALSIVAGPIAQLALGQVVGSAMTLGGQILAAGITMAGGMLINALLPVEQPKQQQIDSSPTYGIDGPKNTSSSGVPVPVIYGTRRIAGNLIGIYTTNKSRDRQQLYMLFCAGEGPVYNVGDVLINDQPASNWDNLELATRLGTTGQSTIGWFNDTITAKFQGQTLTMGSYVNYTTSVEVDKIRLDFSLPSGLFYTYEGGYYAFTSTISMEYSPTGQNNWTGFGGVKNAPVTFYMISGTKYYTLPGGYYGKCKTWTEIYSGGDNFEMGWETQICFDPKPGSNLWTSGGTLVGYVGSERRADNPIAVITEMWTTPSRVSFETDILPEGVYDIRVKRADAEHDGPTHLNVTVLQDVNEIRTEDVAYRNTALLGLSIRLSEQINGIPKVSYEVAGMKVRVWNGTSFVVQYSENPAWQVLDMLTNSRYGGGVPDARIDLDAFKRWADHCDAQGLECHIVIDAQSNLWDAMRPILRAGHAEVVMIGTRYSIAVEKADDPMMVFNVTNIVKGSFNINWLPMAERSNAVEISYYDRTNEYKESTVKVYDPGFDEAVPERVSEITMHGVVDRARAMREAKFHLNLNRYITQTVSFEAPIESIACGIGDLIYIQHDMPFWSYGGRLKAGNTTTLIYLDRDVRMDYGIEYGILVVYDEIQRYTSTIASISGNTVYLNGFDTLKKVDRLVVGAIDLAIREVVTSPSNGVVVDSVAGLSGGQTYTLHETDAMEEAPVSFSAGDQDTILLTSPLPVAPVIGQKFLFGNITSLKKPFRVRSISGDSEFKRQITALEYNDSVYDFTVEDVDTPNYSLLGVGGVINATVTGVVESLAFSGNVIVTNLIIEFDSESPWYRGSDIYISRNGGPEIKVGSGTNSFVYQAGDGDVLDIKVVAFNVLGQYAPRATAPVWQHTVVGKLAPPSDVTGLSIRLVVGGFELSWDGAPDIDLEGYEIREGISWDSGTVIAAKHSSTKLFTPQTQAGTFQYHVKALDTSGNESVGSATVSSTLVAPAAVRGFVAVQNGNVINLRWRSNTEVGLMGYEIREGVTWQAGRGLGSFNTTNATVPADNTSTVRTFWIKAIVMPGVYSDTAVFANTSTAELPDRNVVYTSDQHALGYTGHRINTELLGQDLVLTSGAEYGEYIFEIDLGSTFRAHNFLDLAFDSILVDTETWAGITYSWSDIQAERWWIQLGNDSEIAIDTEIALFTGAYAANEHIGWTFDNTVNSLTGITPLETTAITYQPGRYHDGLYVGDTTTGSWATAGFGTEWTWSFWVKPSDVTGDRVYGVLYHSTSAWFITIGYDGTANEIYAVDNLGQRLAVSVTLAVDDHVCIAVTQDVGERRLFAGVLGQTTPLTPAIAAYGSLGQFNRYRVNP